MKYSVSSDTNLKKIPANTEEVHLIRALKVEKLKKLLEKCKNLKAVYLSASTVQRMAGKSKKLLREKNIEIKLENSRGRAIEIELEKMLQIIDMVKDGRSFREIEKTYAVPKSTVHYLIRYAERTKVKKGSETIYLK